MKIASLSILASLSLISLGCHTALGAVDYEGNLSKIPPTDPEPESSVQILPALKGVHPRVFFTPADIQKLKEQIPTDPILKQTAADLLAWARQFKLSDAKPARTPDIFLTDTPALAVAAGQYPALAYAYALSPSPDQLQQIVNVLTMYVEQPYWADSAELDSNMGASCNMYAAALLYDTVYNDLQPEFRQRVAQKLLLHARRLYYLGFQQLCLMPIKYWQQDPMPNHLWYRLRGLAASVLAISDEEGIDVRFLLAETKKQADYIDKWLPADGSCHEGAGYQQFGIRPITDAALILDRNLGTSYQKNAYFRNAWEQQLYYWSPAMNSNIGFGDDSNGRRFFMYDDPAFFFGPHLTRDANVQAALERYFRKLSARPDGKPPTYPWSFLAGYYDPTVGLGDYKALPTYKLFPDLGAASMRDSWQDAAVIFTFKCGPIGGYALNEYSHANPKDGKPHYVNVAHDDPDPNSFALGIADSFIFHPGRYSLRKMTSGNNAVTVDGKGQMNEGIDYSQPILDRDMRELSYLTGWKTDAQGRIIVEGEAAPAYKDSLLKHFRRTAIWMPGEYILLLDDIVASGQHEITWRGAVEEGKFVKPAEGLCQVLTKTGQKMDFQIIADRDFTGALDYMMMDGRFGNVLLQQFQFTAHSDAVKFATLLDPWKKNARVSMKKDGDTVTLTVKAGSTEDTWTWKPAADGKTPSSIIGKRGSAPLIALEAADKAPTE